VLAHFATVERECDKLREFASPEGSDELNRYNYREHRTYVEVLQDFPSAAKALPLHYLIVRA